MPEREQSSNVEIVTSAIGAIAESNLWALTRLLHPDVRWAVDVADRSAAPWFAEFRGRQGVLDFYEELSKMDHRAFTVKSVAGDGDTVIVWTHVVYGTPNGGEVDMD